MSDPWMLAVDFDGVSDAFLRGLREGMDPHRVTEVRASFEPDRDGCVLRLGPAMVRVDGIEMVRDDCEALGFRTGAELRRLADAAQEPPEAVELPDPQPQGDRPATGRLGPPEHV